MTDPTNTGSPVDHAANAASSLQNIVKLDGLKALVPVLDAFLTQIQTNQAGNLGVVAAINALGPNLLNALTQAGGQITKDAAGSLKNDLDTKAAAEEKAAGG